MAAGIKTQVAKFTQASAEPDAEFFFAESLSRIECDPSRPVHFRTVHGAGYKFLP